MSESSHDEKIPTPDGIDMSKMPPEDKRTLKRAIGGSALGNAVEWFDYGVYSYVSVYIANAFFPGEWGIALTFAFLALSFVFRPLGGFVLRSEEHTSELQSRFDLVCRLLLEKQN